MKKKSILSAVVCCVLSMICLAACVETDSSAELFLPELTHPKTGLSGSDLTIEWLDAEGNATTLDKKRPIMVLFHGQTKFDDKVDMTLPEDSYVDSGDDANLQSGTVRTLSHYWRKMGYNVGIFHYENFAEDGESPEAIMDKVLTRNAPYRNDANEFVNRDLAEMSLADVFWSVWKEVTELTDWTPLQGRRGMEVRFVGNGIGGNIAWAVADYLYARYEAVGGNASALPVRVTAINPVFSEQEHHVKVSYLHDEQYKNLTEGANRTTARLEGKGVVLEYVEENLPETPSDPYKAIMARGAHLEFKQTYGQSENFNRKDRAALDWYLLSMGGSDYSSLSGYANGYENTRPMLDGISEYSNTMVRYSVSPWTPTPYIRAMKGQKFTMQDRKYNSETGQQDYGPYELTKLQAENRQLSDMSTVEICGYVYAEDSANSAYINYAKRLAGVRMFLTVSQSSDFSDATKYLKQYNTVTGADGFYSIAVDPQYYTSDKTYYFFLEAELPSYKYGFVDRTVTGADYLRLEMGTVGSAEQQVTISVTAPKSQRVIRNVGLREYEA